MTAYKYESTVKLKNGDYIDKVVVAPVTAAIYNNIKPENIRENVTILGITGTCKAA